MTVPVVQMADTVVGSAHNIPKNFPRVGGYVTGTPDVRWTDQEWALFPPASHVRIEQGYGALLNVADYDEIDVEAGAISPQTCAGMIAARVAAGHNWTTVYASRNNLALVATAVKAHGDSVWIGHVDCILADWDLNQGEATALVGTMVEGMTCVGVQWASPRSNPDTLLPGTTMTLREANVDLSVVAADWNPSGIGNVPPPPPPPPPAEHYGFVVYGVGDQIVGHPVTSTDLHTWQ